MGQREIENRIRAGSGEWKIRSGQAAGNREPDPGRQWGMENQIRAGSREWEIGSGRAVEESGKKKAEVAMHLWTMNLID